MSDNEKLDINTCFADNIKKFRKTFWSILKDWVNDNYEVLDLLADTPTTLLNADEVWKENKIIPCDFDEKDQVKKWWNLYHNLMYRLKERNKRIDKILP